MKTDLTLPSVALLKNELHLIHDGQGRQVQALTGRLWITQEDDPRDIVLDPGEGYTIEHSGLTVVCALRDATLLVLERTPVQAGVWRRAEQPSHAWPEA